MFLFPIQDCLTCRRPYSKDNNDRIDFVTYTETSSHEDTDVVATSSEQEFVCPHCLEAFGDSWEYLRSINEGDDGYKVDCPSCDKEVELYIETRTTYGACKPTH